jgi:hypothetical protein
VNQPAARGPSHEAAKLLLEQAETFRARMEAVHAAAQLGMPLDEIEAYLDWLDACDPDRAAALEGTFGEREAAMSH